MLNRIVLIGRLTKDPELRYTPTGVAVAQFTLAVDRSFKNKDGQRETDFITIVVYRQQAEHCANYLSKGKLAAVDGRLQIRTYDDNSGQRRWMTEVVADNVRFLSPKDGGSAAGSKSAPSGDDFGAFVEVSVEDDIPF
ncbi:MAG: single-stranded DNA-binding protein [Gracilibacteraceae bacterium]|jgi:single-strand DNA-binding protein|nr:single-stranded DNA-binding protein [Gracilibacteraceae bacterium]